MQIRSRCRTGSLRERSIFWDWRLVKQLPPIAGWALGCWKVGPSRAASRRLPSGSRFAALFDADSSRQSVWDDHNGEYDGASVTDEGWRWIEEHDHLFSLRSRFSSGDLDDLDDDIPY